MKYLLSLCMFLIGCDEKPMINIYQQEILKVPPNCLQLQVSPPNSKIESTLNSIYAFISSCPYKLEVSYKKGIHCNSTQNAYSSALGKFPSSYLKMEVRKGLSLQYSYYIDLQNSVTNNDLSNGINRIREDLGI